MRLDSADLQGYPGEFAGRSISPDADRGLTLFAAHILAQAKTATDVSRIL